MIDLSEEAADYLGLGVSWVNAEILVRPPGSDGPEPTLG